MGLPASKSNQRQWSLLDIVTAAFFGIVLLFFILLFTPLGDSVAASGRQTPLISTATDPRQLQRLVQIQPHPFEKLEKLLLSVDYIFSTQKTNSDSRLLPVVVRRLKPGGIWGRRGSEPGGIWGRRGSERTKIILHETAVGISSVGLLCTDSHRNELQLNYFAPGSSVIMTPVSCCDHRCSWGVQSFPSGCYVQNNLELTRFSIGMKVAPQELLVVFGFSTSQMDDLVESDQAIDGIFGFRQQEISVNFWFTWQGISPRAFSHCLKGENICLRESSSIKWPYPIYIVGGWKVKPGRSASGVQIWDLYNSY
ncbi:Aspartic peptidase domain protein [Raphanus sativus]|nr:Aspartic peptidase domain protein [Raphanus sativus]